MANTFPMNKYKFYQQKLKDGRIRTIAVSTYAGKTVRGTATCALEDTFDAEKGKALAAARCAAAIALKRQSRAYKKVAIAKEEVLKAKDYRAKMKNYLADAKTAVHATQTALRLLEQKM